MQLLYLPAGHRTAGPAPLSFLSLLDRPLAFVSVTEPAPVQGIKGGPHPPPAGLGVCVTCTSPYRPSGGMGLLGHSVVGALPCSSAGNNPFSLSCSFWLLGLHQRVPKSGASLDTNLPSPPSSYSSAWTLFLSRSGVSHDLSLSPSRLTGDLTETLVWWPLVPHQ